MIVREESCLQRVETGSRAPFNRGATAAVTCRLFSSELSEKLFSKPAHRHSQQIKGYY